MRASTPADAAVTNGGGIRGGKIYPPGSALTTGDILVELPFDNRVLIIDITGAELVRALENGLFAIAHSQRSFSAGLRTDDRGRSESPRRRPHPVDQGRRGAARQGRNLSDSDQRFHGARRRRLSHVPGRQAAPPTARRAAALARGDRAP